MPVLPRNEHETSAAHRCGRIGELPVIGAKAGTIAATIAAGPLNYVGVNPKINCTVTVPQPSH